MPSLLHSNRTYVSIGGDYMNQTEVFIKAFYKSINLMIPSVISISNVTDILNINLIHWSNTSAMTYYNKQYFMFINEFLTPQQQWQEFGHEVCHYFNDRINRKNVNNSFVDYCETKADYFAYHFCVPTFMLQKMKRIDVYDVMQLFNVEFDFALRRLEMYHNKILSKGVL